MLKGTVVKLKDMKYSDFEKLSSYEKETYELFFNEFGVVTNQYTENEVVIAFGREIVEINPKLLNVLDTTNGASEIKEVSIVVEYDSLDLISIKVFKEHYNAMEEGHNLRMRAKTQRNIRVVKDVKICD